MKTRTLSAESTLTVHCSECQSAQGILASVAHITTSDNYAETDRLLHVYAMKKKLPLVSMFTCLLGSLLINTPISFDFLCNSAFLEIDLQ
ncbi:hypothetical protein GDO78_013051 [Eleutherodactylus coqui]|uniref:Uncharacterized protein n=1 Tax=Eleutherodactylus coqui TaxID=57060 RepID=A0A8J6K734_ELECQ|nr:hypothetical protein GDO78_013051 [Eleutherodactylus coqui]